MIRGLVGVSALVGAALTHYVAVAWFLIGTCAVSDTVSRVPAPASAQGVLCDRQESWLNVVPYVALGVSLVTAVVLAVALWRRGRWRWLGLTAWLWLPVLVNVVLALPSNTCNEAQLRDLRARDCQTTVDG